MHAFHFYLSKWNFAVYRVGIGLSRLRCVCQTRATFATNMICWSRKLYIDTLRNCLSVFFMFLDVKFIWSNNILDNLRWKVKKCLAVYLGRIVRKLECIELNFSLMMQYSWILQFYYFLYWNILDGGYEFLMVEETGKISILKRGKRYLMFLPWVEFNVIILGNNLNIYILGEYMEIEIFWRCNVFVNNY